MAVAVFVPAAADAASPLDFAGSAELVDLAPYIDVYEDPSSTQDFASIRTASFAPVTRLRLSDPRATYWLRFSFSGATPLRPWMLTAGFRPYEADLYLPGPTGWRVLHSGDATPYSQRPFAVYIGSPSICRTVMACNLRICACARSNRSST